MSIIEESFPIVSDQHQHTGDTYSVDGVEKPGIIVCSDCHPDHLQGGNECFCKCHTVGKLECRGCRGYHHTVISK